MIWFSLLLVIYVCVGLGFALASWLQAAEIEVNEKGDYSFDIKTFLFFIVSWPLVSVYCFRTEVSRTISKIDLDKLREHKSTEE